MAQDAVTVEAEPAPPSSPRQVGLGLFILFQLAFLVVGNAVGFLRSARPEHFKDQPKRLVNGLAPNFADDEGHIWSWSERVEADTRCWMQLTGQDQDWALFTSAGKATGFPVLLLIWDDAPAIGPSIPGSRLDYNAKDGFNLITPWDPQAVHLKVVWLPSENAPADPNSFVKLGMVRVRRYEGEFYQNALPEDAEPREHAEKRMTGLMQDLLHSSHDLALAYMQTRLRAWRRAHPGEPPPKQVVLFERFYRIHDPDEAPGWDGPFLVPQARWRPRDDKGKEALEPFDFSDQRFQAPAREAP